MIVVTGASGIVGRALRGQLADQGQACFCTARRYSQQASTETGLSLDLSQPGAGEALARHIGQSPSASGRPSAIIHLAAAIPHSDEFDDHQRYYSATKAMDAQVAELQARLDLPLIYVSSCGLYDRLDPTIKTPKTAKLSASTPYFQAKLEGEALFAASGKASIFRLSNPVGPGVPSKLVVPLFFKKMRQTKRIEVWGRGTREQDFIDVRDAARLLLAAACAPKAGVYNLAFGLPTSMFQLARHVQDALGSGQVSLPGHKDALEQETARYCIKDSRADFDWQPTHTIADMCRHWKDAF